MYFNLIDCRWLDVLRLIWQFWFNLIHRMDCATGIKSMKIARLYSVLYNAIVFMQSQFWSYCSCGFCKHNNFLHAEKRVINNFFFVYMVFVEFTDLSVFEITLYLWNTQKIKNNFFWYRYLINAIQSTIKSDEILFLPLLVWVGLLRACVTFFHL